MFDLKFLIILFIGFVDYIGLGLVYPVFAVMLFDTHYPLVDEHMSLGARGALLGLLFSLTPLCQFFTSHLLGVFSDIKGRRVALLLGISAGCLGYAVAIAGVWLNSLSLIIIYTVLSGISDSTAAVAQSVIADISTEKNKARHFGYFNSSLGLGFTIGPFMGGKLADPHFASWAGYAVPFIVAGMMMLLNLILVFWKFPETYQPKTSQPFKVFHQLQNISKALTLKKLRWLFLGGFAFSLGWSFFNEFMPVLWIERFNFSSSDVGNFYGYSGLWYAFSATVLITPLIKYFSSERLVFLASIFCAISFFAYSLIENPFYIWIVTPFVVSMLAIGFPTATAAVSNQIGQNNQGEVLGIFMSIQALAMGVTPLLFGFFIGIYPESAVWGGGISLILAAFAFFMSQKKMRSL